MKNRLEELRKQKGIKQEELANAWKYQGRRSVLWKMGATIRRFS